MMNKKQIMEQVSAWKYDLDKVLENHELRLMALDKHLDALEKAEKEHKATLEEIKDINALVNRLSEMRSMGILTETAASKAVMSFVNREWKP